MGTIKDRNSTDLTEAEDIKRWQEHTEELYKQVLHDSDNQDGVHSSRARHPGMWSQVGLESITMNKASGGDEFQLSYFKS